MSNLRLSLLLSYRLVYCHRSLIDVNPMIIRYFPQPSLQPGLPLINHHFFSMQQHRTMIIIRNINNIQCCTFPNNFASGSFIDDMWYIQKRYKKRNYMGSANQKKNKGKGRQQDDEDDEDEDEDDDDEDEDYDDDDDDEMKNNVEKIDSSLASLRLDVVGSNCLNINRSAFERAFLEVLLLIKYISRVIYVNKIFKYREEFVLMVNEWKRRVMK